MVSYEDRIKNPGLNPSSSSYEERVKNPGINSIGVSSNEISKIVNTTDKDELWFKYNSDVTFRYLIDSNYDLSSKFNKIFQSYIDSSKSKKDRQ